MRYDYELLKNHVSRCHPEVLVTFLQGWNKLGPLSQAHWRQLGLIAPREKVESRHWLSWATAKVSELFESKEGLCCDTPLSHYERQLAGLFHDSMQHSGELFDLPYMPPLKNRVYSCPDRYHSSPSELHMIVKDAANVIVHSVLTKLVSKWKKDLDERGLD